MLNNKTLRSFWIDAVIFCFVVEFQVLAELYLPRHVTLIPP
jgi:hypothetical protein